MRRILYHFAETQLEKGIGKNATLPGIEPGTLCSGGTRDVHYTTEPFQLGRSRDGFDKMHWSQS